MSHPQRHQQNNRNRGNASQYSTYEGSRNQNNNPRHFRSQQQQQTNYSASSWNDSFPIGPQDGGFDTSGWGNYQNFYPTLNQYGNPSTEKRNEPRTRAQATNNNRARSSNNPHAKDLHVPCDDYLPEEQVLQDIAAKKTIRGFLRINPKQYMDAFITDPDGGNDFYIDNVRDRNRALHSDEVAAEIKPKREWKIIPEYSNLVSSTIRDLRLNSSSATTTMDQPGDSPTKRDHKRDTLQSLTKENITLTDEMISQIPDAYFQRTVKVVFIFRRRHTMKTAGFLRKMPDNSPHYALFSPMDSRIPRLMIPMNQCPPDFKDRPQDYEKSLFVARIVEIPADKKFARGELMDSLGEADTLEAQSKAILMENDIQDKEFSDDVIQCLPLAQERWSIPEEEFSKRLDLREKCIFTIDPATARDLDDALSCEVLENGEFRIGVHIADVSYFVQEQSALDNEAAERTTSVYLVERVIPMLPRLLCDRLCSLNPGEDRLTYSVIWRMNDQGEILEEEFTRSIIRSCVKLSYEHAQDVIEHPEKNFQITDLPPIHGSFTPADIQRVIHNLYRISKVLRAKRAGALTLNQPKLQYQINADTKIPLSFSIYQQKDSHRLVEEFMLLANMQVARKLCSIDRIFDKVILRRHPPPNPTAIQATLKLLKSIGIEINGNSSDEICRAIQTVDNDSIKRLIVHLLAKSMQLAVYCCASCVPDKNFSHYALNVDYYTHFTSPIRRYPDILVHRLLGAMLNYNENLYQNPRALEQIAQLCNEKKMNAKACSERSAELHLAFLIKEYGTLSDQAIIAGVKDQSLDVYIFRIGVAVRVGINNLPLDHPRTEYQALAQGQESQLTIFWKQDNPPQVIKQVLRPSTVVYVDIMSEFDLNMKKMKLTAQLRHPNAEKLTNLMDLCSKKVPETAPVIEQELDFDPYTEY